MDSVDLKLLKLLNSNAKISLSEMGREVGLSISGVRKRIIQLEKDGVIKSYVAVIDPQKVGFEVVAFISVDVDSRSERDLVRSLTHRHEVCELHRITGGHGLMLKVRTRSLDSLNKFVKRYLHSRDSVKGVRIMVAMETVKESLVNF